MPTNLPLQLTSFVGREREMLEIERLLSPCLPVRERSVRLLTLTGPGGSGKTRLALQAAADLLDAFPDGVWWVEFSLLQHPALLTQSIAAVLQIRESPETSLLDSLISFLREKKLLLLFDNCEHLIEACARLAEVLLRACPELRILATSREALGVPGEINWSLSPLSVPDPKFIRLAEAAAGGLPSSVHPADLVKEQALAAELTECESVRLFVDRALDALPSFTLTMQNMGAVAQICYHLDGLPLAIELAAARVKTMPVNQIAARLVYRFQLLTQSARSTPPRQSTLRRALDWSYDLLSEAEQVLFRQLSVFSGGWTLESAEFITSSSDQDEQSGQTVSPGGVGVEHLLTRLVDKSLVIVDDQSGQARFHWLETIAEYARERLVESGEEQRIYRRFANLFVHIGESTSRGLSSEDQALALTKFEEEYDNLREALKWTLTSQENELALRLSVALWRFWLIRGNVSEGRRWLAAALASERGEPGELRAKALNAAGVLARRQGDYAQAIAYHQEGLAIQRQVGNRPGVAAALNSLGNVAFFQGDYSTAIGYFEASLAIQRELNDAPGITKALNNLGNVMIALRDFHRAQMFFEECLDLGRDLGNIEEIANDHTNLGVVALHQGDHARAKSHLEEGLRLVRSIQNRRGIAICLINLGDINRSQGYLPEAGSCYKESLILFRELEDKEGIASVIEGLASLAAIQGKTLHAARLCGAAEALRETISAPLSPADRALYEITLEAARASLAPDVFAAVREGGRVLSLDQVVANALAELPRREEAARVVPAREQEDKEHLLLLPAQPELRIFALGSPRVYRREREIPLSDWKYVKTREMFFFLLCNPPRTKEQVGVALWPEASPAQLRSNFRVALYHLRHALGRSEWICFENERYAFNRALPYWFDADVFAQCIADGKRSIARGKDDLSAIHHLQSAIDLYQGEFLEGWNTGVWHCQRRKELERNYLDALLVLGQLYTAQAQYPQAASVYRQAIVADGYQEEAHRGLMRCYARQGERGQALRHYQELSDLLRDELGAPPAPETQELYAQLLRGKSV